MPYEPVILGFKFDIKVKQLTGRDVVRVTCEQCHKIHNVAPHVFYERYHDYLPLEAVAKDFVCKRCGGRQLSWSIERAVGPQFPRSA